MLTVMVVGGTALIVDHRWLVDQRNTLKAGSDAAAVAAVQKMNAVTRADASIEDATLKAQLEPLARRYILLNLSHLGRHRFEQARDSLVVEVVPDRASRTVAVSAEADLGGYLLARIVPAFMPDTPLGPIRTGSGTEMHATPVELVLALDISNSMNWGAGREWGFQPGDEARIDVGKRAARNVVALLDPQPHSGAAIGLVPWNNAVRLDQAAAARWESLR